MPDSSIANLVTYSAVQDTDVLAIVDSGGTTKKVPVSRLNRKVMALSAADQALTAGTTAQFITGSNLLLPVAPNTLTLIQWKIILEKTSAAGTAAISFSLRSGTNGSVSDTARITGTFGASTAATDIGRLDIMALFASVGSGTTAVVKAAATLTHSLNTGGLLSVAGQTLNGASSGYDSTATGGLNYNLSITPGTSNAITIREVVSEAVNV